MSLSVAIVIVNYNGYDDTVECVKSIKKINYDNYRIFLVDNASRDKTRLLNDPFLAQNAEIILSSENLGFSGGNNLAIEKAVKQGYNFILLLNNDTVVEANFLHELVKTAEAHTRIGVVTGKIYYYYQRDTVWSAGGAYDRTTGLTEQYSGKDNGQFDIEKEISFSTGCLMLIPSEVIKQVGKMDESYFLYSEDSDYCQKIMDAGYKLFYTPKAIIYHKVSASTGDRSPIQQRYMMRNNLYMIKRFSEKPFNSYKAISWHMFKHIVRGRRNLIPTLQGYVDFLIGRTGKIK